MAANLVRLLPLASIGMHIEDVRIICDCQVHAARERTFWRLSVRTVTRAVKQVGRKGFALLIGVPIALGFLEMPTEAMNMSFAQMVRVTSTTFTTTIGGAFVSEPTSTPFPVFTTPAVAEAFLPVGPTETFTLERAKEEFFRTHVPYGSIIYREAKKNELPPELVAAVISAESDFRKNLTSNKNAQGLMQIMPSTGKLLGVEDLYDPSANIAAGTRYLRYLHRRFGSERVALAAYNAGEGNVEKFGGIPPFPETLNYIRRVDSRRHAYRQRIRGSYVSAARFRSAVGTMSE